ncbi:MAG TPA: hypothetical protein VFC77_08760 [Myxococcota bacterium]|nr:hypothetical protein [Myxococcota bacterium]
MASPELPAASDEHFAERLLASLERAVALLAVLLLMATIGLVLTNVGSPYAFHYWAAMLPLFGVAALWEELRRRPSGSALGPAVLRLVAHWTGPLAALWIVFRFLDRSQVDGRAAGLLALLVLALSCFFSGIYGAPVWLVVALFLSAGIVFALELAPYLWLLLVLGALLVGGLVFWRMRARA